MLTIVFLYILPVSKVKISSFGSLLFASLVGLVYVLVYLSGVKILARVLYRQTVSIRQIGYLLAVSYVLIGLIFRFSQHFIWLNLIFSITLAPYAIYLQFLAIKSGCGFTRSAPAVWTSVLSAVIAGCLILIPGLYVIRHFLS
jgi:hypothetical protein